MKVRSLERYVDADLASRVRELRSACAEVDGANPNGLNATEATSVVRKWKPIFGDLRLEKDGATWVVAVYHYCCSVCRLNFDERDMPAGKRGAGIFCPGCGAKVVAAGSVPPAPVASKSLDALEAVERAKIRAAKGGSP
jgi:DNA-directed RNA polymerase subunit RPC12/RpoP